MKKPHKSTGSGNPPSDPIRRESVGKPPPITVRIRRWRIRLRGRNPHDHQYGQQRRLVHRVVSWAVWRFDELRTLYVNVGDHRPVCGNLRPPTLRGMRVRGLRRVPFAHDAVGRITYDELVADPPSPPTS
jgi:hypothetical protein